MLHSPPQSRWLSLLPIQDRWRYPAERLIIEGAEGDEDDGGRSAYVVLDGIVRLSLLSDDGREHVLAYLPVGSLFGEQAAIGQRGLGAQLVAVADETCEVGRITAADLIDIVRRNPEALIDLMGITGTKTSLFLQALARSSFGSTGAQIATILGALGCGRERLDITQDRLAQISGLTRVTVAKQLHRLEAAGAISLERSRIVIRKRELLQDPVSASAETASP